MPEFMTILSLYYMCDQAAAMRGLNAEEVARCMANYEQLKMEFVDEPHARLGSVERAAQIRLGYRRLKSWENENAELVQELRQDARSYLSES